MNIKWQKGGYGNPLAFYLEASIKDSTISGRRNGKAGGPRTRHQTLDPDSVKHLSTGFSALLKWGLKFSRARSKLQYFVTLAMWVRGVEKFIPLH